MGGPVRAARPWAKTSARTGGTSPLSRMGGCRVPVPEDRDCQGADEPTHWLMLGDAETGQERDPARRPQPRSGTAAPRFGLWQCG
jgi:hypothetical protein